VGVIYPGFPQPIRVLDGASIRVAPGELVQLTGPNGSGKSTLLRYLAGEVAGQGRVIVPGATRAGNGRLRHAAVALIHQDSSGATCATLTPREHLVLYLTGGNGSAVRRWSKVHLDDAAPLRRVLAFGDVPVACLSGGQRQVLNVTSLIVRSDAPRVVLFDEPLTYLDEANAGTCIDLIGELLRRDCRVVLVQHDLNNNESNDGESKMERQSTRRRLSALVTRHVSIKEIQHRR
jgi:ABC-type Mn2+/Zn2+ transport system ATPase subunit